MSIGQFLRIFWAHRWLTLATAFSCVAGAFLVILLVPPKYVAHSRVMLNLLKPDPVTGEYVANNAARTYVATQVGLIKDDAVAGQAVQNLGWIAGVRRARQMHHGVHADKRATPVGARPKRRHAMIAALGAARRDRLEARASEGRRQGGANEAVGPRHQHAPHAGQLRRS